jgi:hypothetical protein
MAEQVAQRNPNGMSPVVLLMDGQESLWQAGWRYLPETLAEVTEILDLLHALASLWEAAHLFHPNGSDVGCPKTPFFGPFLAGFLDAEIVA